MSDNITQEAILHGDLIQRINAGLAPYDVHKLIPSLLGDFNVALAAARSGNSALALAAGDQAGARGRGRAGG